LDAVAVSGALLRYCTWPHMSISWIPNGKKKKPSLLTRPAETDRDPLRRRHRHRIPSPPPPLLPRLSTAAAAAPTHGLSPSPRRCCPSLPWLLLSLSRRAASAPARTQPAVAVALPCPPLFAALFPCLLVSCRVAPLLPARCLFLAAPLLPVFPLPLSAVAAPAPFPCLPVSRRAAPLLPARCLSVAAPLLPAFPLPLSAVSAAPARTQPAPAIAVALPCLPLFATLM
jgi:hypothetical protein